jgi:hypothetical protein
MEATAQIDLEMVLHPDHIPISGRKRERAVVVDDQADRPELSDVTPVKHSFD